jgi:Ca2+-binding EF-hand superfamily protein
LLQGRISPLKAEQTSLQNYAYFHPLDKVASQEVVTPAACRDDSIESVQFCIDLTHPLPLAPQTPRSRIDEEHELSNETLETMSAASSGRARNLAEATTKDIAVKRLFIALDRNRDGTIDAVEFRNFLIYGLGVACDTIKQAAQSLWFKDIDKDGRLSLDELALACKELDAATVLRFCEPIEREAGMHVHQKEPLEPPPAMLFSCLAPWARCCAQPRAQAQELVVSSKDPLKSRVLSIVDPQNSINGAPCIR